MGEDSRIEWTDHTFNAWWGCTRVPRPEGSACDNCYAAELANRFGQKWGPQHAPRTFGEKHWNDPRRWNRKAEAAGKRARVFTLSMGDLFEIRGNEHDATMDTERAKLWALIEETPWLDWLLLTKRPQHVMRLIPERWRGGMPANVWLGSTIESQPAADERVPELLRIPAAVRFVSCEPLLGPVDLTRIGGDDEMGTTYDALRGVGSWAPDDAGGQRISWVIAGGESGSRPRPSHPQWFRDLRDQCGEAGVSFHFKQWGEWADSEHIEQHGTCPHGWYEADQCDGGRPVHSWPDAHVRESCRRLGKPEPQGPIALDTHVYMVGKKHAGRHLDGRTWDEVPDVG